MIVLGGIWALINYSAVAAVPVVNITAGFLYGHYTYKVLTCIFVVIILFGLYQRIVFQMIKVGCGILLLIVSFYKMLIDKGCQDGEGTSQYCLRYAHWSTRTEDMIQTALVAPLGESLLVFSWSTITTFVLSVFLTEVTAALNKKLPSFITEGIFLIIGGMRFVVGQRSGSGRSLS
jgi:uncharacterized membrane protein YjgN (DUF898 family)